MNVVILGAGNVAWHLGHQLKTAGHNIVQVYNRTTFKGEALAHELDAAFTNKLDEVDKDAEVYILAVSDHGIDDIILELRLPGKIVAHTSGAVPLKGMEHISENCGIFYPLQTFTKGTKVDFTEIPMLIEAANDEVKNKLTELAKTISNRVEYLDSHKRRALHVAAVFVNNFTNYLYGIAHDITEREKLDLSLLFPLMQETLNKLKTNKPQDVQTGPAKRSDFRTIEEHLTYLASQESYRETYLVLTESIMAMGKEKPKGVGDQINWDFGDNFDEDMDTTDMEDEIDQIMLDDLENGDDFE